MPRGGRLRSPGSAAESENRNCRAALSGGFRRVADSRALTRAFGMEPCPRDAAPSPREPIGQRDARHRPRALGLATLIVGDGPVRAAGVLALIGIVLASRVYRPAVETRSDSITVWGMVRTRVIPRASITEITNYPAIVWTDPAGRRRWSPVLASKPRHGHSPASPSTMPHA
jgi:hypothetical protein